MSIYNCHKQQPQPWMSYIASDKPCYQGGCCPVLIADRTHLLPFQIISNGSFMKMEISPYGEDTWTIITITYSEVSIDGFYIISYDGSVIDELECGAYDFRLTAGEVWYFETITIKEFEDTENAYTIRDDLMLPFKFSEQQFETLPLIARCDEYMPFMFATDNPTYGNVIVYLYDVVAGCSVEELDLDIEVLTISGKTYYIFAGACIYPFLECGLYKLEIVDGEHSYFSVPFSVECDISDIPDGYRVMLDFNRCVMRDEYGEIIYEECSNIPEPEPEITDISFGLLYNAYVVIYNTGGASIAPAGWHIPTEDEWFDLFNEIDTQNTCGYEMMEVGTTHWNTGNGTNTSGFTAVGNGWRLGTNGNFEKLMEASPMWTSSPNYGTSRYAFYTKFSGDDVDETFLIFPSGCAIRLIKDDANDPGTVTDYDGNIYETVKIGSQVWTKSNLIVKHFNNGVAIPEETNAATWIGLVTPAWCYYNNDPANM